MSQIPLYNDFLTGILEDANNALTEGSYWIVFFNLGRFEATPSMMQDLEYTYWDVGAKSNTAVSQFMYDIERTSMLVQGIEIPGDGFGVTREGDNMGGFLKCPMSTGRSDLPELNITFRENNASVTDLVLRPWVIHTSYASLKYASKGTVTCYNLTRSPVGFQIRKSFSFFNAVPISIDSEQYIYTASSDTQHRQVKFIYSHYAIGDGDGVIDDFKRHFERVIPVPMEDNPTGNSKHTTTDKAIDDALDEFFGGVDANDMSMDEMVQGVERTLNRGASGTHINIHGGFSAMINSFSVSLNAQIRLAIPLYIGIHYNSSGVHLDAGVYFNSGGYRPNPWAYFHWDTPCTFCLPIDPVYINQCDVPCNHYPHPVQGVVINKEDTPTFTLLQSDARSDDTTSSNTPDTSALKFNHVPVSINKGEYNPTPKLINEKDVGEYGDNNEVKIEDEDVGGYGKYTHIVVDNKPEPIIISNKEVPMDDTPSTLGMNGEAVHVPSNDNGRVKYKLRTISKKDVPDRLNSKVVQIPDNKAYNPTPIIVQVDDGDDAFNPKPTIIQVDDGDDIYNHTSTEIVIDNDKASKVKYTIISPAKDNVPVKIKSNTISIKEKDYVKDPKSALINVNENDDEYKYRSQVLTVNEDDAIER